MIKLEVRQVEKDDVFEDLIRLHPLYRDKINSGTIIKLTVIHENKERTHVFGVARNSYKNETGIIRLDDAMRKKLGVEENKKYEFEIQEACHCESLYWGWHATNPTNRIATRIALLSFALGALSLILAFVPLFKD